MNKIETYEFQSYISAIKTNGDVESGSIYENFNPTLVRLKQTDVVGHDNVIPAFQSYISAIKTPYWEKYNNHTLISILH